MFLDPDPRPLSPNTAGSSIPDTRQRSAKPDFTKQFPPTQSVLNSPRRVRSVLKKRKADGTTASGSGSGGGVFGLPVLREPPRAELRSSQPRRRSRHERNPSELSVRSIRGRAFRGPDGEEVDARPSTSATDKSVGVVEDASEMRLSKPTIRLIENASGSEASSPTSSGGSPSKNPLVAKAVGPQEKQPYERASLQALYLPQSRTTSATPPAPHLSGRNSDLTNPQIGSSDSAQRGGSQTGSSAACATRVSDPQTPTNHRALHGDGPSSSKRMSAARAGSTTPSSTSRPRVFEVTSSRSIDTPTATGDALRSSLSLGSPLHSHRRDTSAWTLESEISAALGDDSIFSAGGSNFGGTATSRTSFGTTLRGTPISWDHDNKDDVQPENVKRPLSVQLGAPQTQAPLESLSKSTKLEPVALSDISESSSATETRPRSGATQLSLPSFAPSPSLEVQDLPTSSVDAIRPSSESSQPLSKTAGAHPLTIRQVSPSSSARPPTGSSLTHWTPSSKEVQSSPNFVTFSSDTNPETRPATGTYLRLSFSPSRLLPSPTFRAYSPDSARAWAAGPRLRSQSSLQSLDSVVRYATSSIPPLKLSPSIETLRSSRFDGDSSNWQALHKSSSKATLLSSTSSKDTLPPLNIPRKRLRHKVKSNSLSSIELPASITVNMADLDIDLDPFQRHHYTSHLSTIASESVGGDSRHISSQFSLGSGVLTGDDRSSIPLSGRWSTRRRASMPLTSRTDDESPDDGLPSTHSLLTGSSPSDEPGDMTLGIFRESSAKPEPLRPVGRPSLPPQVPNDGNDDEDDDILSALSSPQLRPKRSGYSLRQATSSGLQLSSLTEGDRTSGASSIFPIWAKYFYAGGAQLLSASAVSLGGGGSSSHRRPSHLRSESQWTQHSFYGPYSTSYSLVLEPAPSPSSSHILPSIFRPKARSNSASAPEVVDPSTMAKAAGSSITPKAPKSGSPLNPTASGSTPKPGKLRKTRKPGDGMNRSNSMAILPAAMPGDEFSEESLPSGHPKYGRLKTGSPTPMSDQQGRRPVGPYGKQKDWDSMVFPRPMTKERLSDFGVHPPYLPAAEQRASADLSAWRAPSFVESLDTLIKSRGNRQILLFAVGFCLPLCWMLASVLPLPQRPRKVQDPEKEEGGPRDVTAVMMEHEAGDAERHWREERTYLKARWWRRLNRIMSVVGVLIIAAVIALVLVATL